MNNRTRLNTGLIHGSGKNGSYNIYFEDHMDHLCQHIREADEVYGCAFRLTNSKIIEALGAVKSCQILVDKGNGVPIQNFSSLKCNRSAESFLAEYPPAYNDGKWNKPLEPVRVVGSLMDGAGLMHHKFMVFTRSKDSRGREGIYPYAVWFGSCNFSANANRSFEYGYFSRDRSLVGRFFKQYVEVLARSENIYDHQRDFTPQWYRLTA
jgi:hypothetical protein